MRPSPLEQFLHQQELSRRQMLKAAATIAGVGLISLAPGTRVQAAPRFAGYPFALGVASGDPLPSSVILWTRLSTDSLGATGAGIPSSAVVVHWMVALDQKLEKIVKQGNAVAVPELAHSVHVDVRGLEPDREYFYAFRVGGEQSPVGRTKTTPAAGAKVDKLRFAFMSCSDWQNGYFTAYDGLAQENLDFALHLGDYIYEYAADPKAVRQHNSDEIMTLEDYRRRYALYKGDKALQAAHAAFPWIVIPDDHEVENNYAGLVPEENQALAPFVGRRAAAYQAYYENQPLRRMSLPKGNAIQLYRRFTFGDMAEFAMLDTRQYRTDQPCDDNFKPRCAAVTDPNATLTGPAQEKWLLEGLGKSQARWNVIGQQVMMAQFDWQPGQGQVFNMDQWDGYPAGRNRILGYLQQAKPSNPVVLTGDIHSSWVSDLKADFDDAKSAVLGTELVTTSISADFPTQFIPGVTAALTDNPHVKYFNGASRGYVRCELTPQTWTTDFRVTSSIKESTAKMSTHATFVQQSGKAGSQKV
jgi:alkaline phosphatase D